MKRSFSIVIVVAAGATLWAPAARGDDAAVATAAAIDAIRHAPDQRAAGRAYVEARRNAPDTPQVYRTYIERLLVLNQARLAHLPARDLLRLQPNDPLAWGVTGYAQASRNRLLQAYEAYVRAAAADSKNEGILYSAGIACTWQASEGITTVAPEVKALADKHLRSWQQLPAFKNGQATAKAAYQERNDRLRELDDRVRQADRDRQAAEAQDADKARRYKQRVDTAKSAQIRMKRAEYTLSDIARKTGGGGGLHEHYKAHIEATKQDYYKAQAEYVRSVKEARSLARTVKARDNRIASADRTLASAKAARQRADTMAPKFPWQPPSVAGGPATETSLPTAAGPATVESKPNKPPPENLPKLLAGIQKAPNIGDASAAYASACRTAAHCAEVHHVYLEMLLTFGKPSLATPTATHLLRLKPDDALAHGLIGYRHATGGNLPQAFNATMRSAAIDPHNTGVLHNAAFLTLWRQSQKIVPGVSIEADDLMKSHLAAWRPKQPFQDARVAAAKALSERAGAIQNAETARQRARRKLDDENKRDAGVQAAYDRAMIELDVTRRQIAGRNASVSQMSGVASRTNDPTYHRQLQVLKQELKEAQIRFDKANRAAREAVDTLRLRNARLKQAQRELTAAETARAKAEKITPTFDFQPPAVAGKVVPEGRVPVTRAPAAPRAPRQKPAPPETPQPAGAKESPDDAQAAKQLAMAKMLLANNRRQAAIDNLKAIVQKYPKTPAGIEANGMLTKIFAGRL